MKSILLLAVILSAVPIFSQVQNKSSILLQSDKYYWGEARSQNIKEASDAALKDLLNKISIRVQSSFLKKITGNDDEIKENVESILDTYSGATLNNVNTIKTEVEEEFEVFHYIAKEEVKKIFEERKKLVENIYKKAKEFEKELNYSYALKWYYFSIMLMNSIPEANLMCCDINLTTEIPIRINQIINGLRFKLISNLLISENEREVIIEILSKDQLVQSLDFSFWDGANQVNIRAVDGEGIIRLFGVSTNFENLKLSIKYNYYESKDEIKEVSELWNMVSKPTFKNLKQINLTEIDFPNVDSIVISSSSDENEIIDSTNVNELPIDINYMIVSQVNEIIDLINNDDQKRIEDFCNEDIFLLNKIKSIKKHNNPRVISKNQEAQINKTYEGWEFRKIPVVTYYPSINKQSKEYLVLDFDKNGKFYDINFGIVDNLYQTFVQQAKYGNDWGNRQVIIKFFEKYRTSFLTRDLNSLESLFSDEALIIVGRILERKKNNDIYKYAPLNNSQPDIDYLTLTKSQYLKRQTQIFKSRQDIFLGYSTFNITRKNKQPGIYGISLRQDYLSTDYSDEGYLFLLVDFLDEHPQIYVRSWQPKVWDDSSLIKLSNFNVNR